MLTVESFLKSMTPITALALAIDEISLMHKTRSPIDGQIARQVLAEYNKKRGTPEMQAAFAALYKHVDPTPPAPVRPLE